MSIPDRLYNIAKSQLSRAKDRWDEIDASAQQELDAFVASHSSNNDASAWDRALGKINSARTGQELQASQAPSSQAPLPPEPSLDELEARVAADQAGDQAASPPSAPYSPPQGPPPAATLRAAYKMLGVEPGADWLTVQTAYRKLRERASPERFPQGSAEQDAARSIQRRIDSAYTMLNGILDPEGNRFDRLEL